jgi:hypothetical protein
LLAAPKDTIYLLTATLRLPIFLAIESRHIPLLCTWLNVESLGVLDIAVSSHGARKPWLTILKSIGCQAIDVWCHSHSSMIWMMLRGLHVTQVLVNINHKDRVSDETFVAVGITCGGISYDDEVKSGSIWSMWDERKYLLSINLSGCRGFRDMGISALTNGYGQLHTINLSKCQGITDMGVSALGDGCGQLHTIDLDGCQGITDMGMSALADRCGQLHTINLAGSHSITDMGLSALADRCGQLHTINLNDCHRITDMGVSWMWSAAYDLSGWMP